MGVSAAQVKPWIELIERAAGRRVDAVLTRHMAMLGLGLQEYDRASVLEMGDEQSWGAVHRFSQGLVERLGEAWGPGDDLSEHAVVIGAAPEGVRARVIGGDELAVGAALARAVAGGSFVTLDGSPARAVGKWLAPIGALAAAGLLFVGASAWYESRIARASERLESRMAQISADVQQASAARGETLETMALIESARRATDDARGKMLPALVAALDAVSTGGFVYTLEISRDRLMMRGEAGRAGDVVRAIENSDAFAGARLVSPVTASRTSGNEVFDVMAAREGVLQ